jgi:hypothetical protein
MAVERSQKLCAGAILGRCTGMYICGGEIRGLNKLVDVDFLHFWGWSLLIGSCMIHSVKTE